MASIIDYLTKGVQIIFSSLKCRCYYKKFPGDATQVCQAIVKKCWNGRFFQTSATNFPEFWSRDFGWCTQSLIKLDYNKEIHQTLRYALNTYNKHNKITTTINKRGKPFNVFVPAIDSLPWLIHSIQTSKFGYHSYKGFLNKEINKFFNNYINQETGLVKQNLHTSSMKDFSIRSSSCYDNCMVALLAKHLTKMKLNNPFSKYNYQTIIKQNFWNGSYFYDDSNKKDYVAGDANVFPFLLGIFDDKEMVTSVINKIQENELDQPLPLKYTKSRDGIKFSWQEFFMRNYESNSVWTHMGLLYVKLVEQVDSKKAKEYKQAYKETIEKFKGFPEVLTASGEKYTSIIYHSDMSMLWAANYLTL
jgi:hypothetical protein